MRYTHTTTTTKIKEEEEEEEEEEFIASIKTHCQINFILSSL